VPAHTDRTERAAPARRAAPNDVHAERQSVVGRRPRHAATAHGHPPPQPARRPLPGSQPRDHSVPHRSSRAGRHYAIGGGVARSPQRRSTHSPTHGLGLRRSRTQNARSGARPLVQSATVAGSVAGPQTGHTGRSRPVEARRGTGARRSAHTVLAGAAVPKLTMRVRSPSPAPSTLAEVRGAFDV
jgi:hypothetical protein